MRTIRCFVNAELKIDSELFLPETSSNHISRVLRMQLHDKVTVFNGDGKDYTSVITGIEKKFVRIKIEHALIIANESPLRVHLYQSIARGEKMDWILQKATELGVTEFTPIMSDRTEVKLDQDRADKRIQHWLGVIHSACEQSGRAVVPVLNSPIAINQLKLFTAVTQAFYLDPRAQLRIASINAELAHELSLAIGPEGGFSERDIHLLQTAGFTGLQMGPRIMRTETAGIALIAALQSRFGDW